MHMTYERKEDAYELAKRVPFVKLGPNKFLMYTNFDGIPLYSTIYTVPLFETTEKPEQSEPKKTVSLSGRIAKLFGTLKKK